MLSGKIFFSRTLKLFFAWFLDWLVTPKDKQIIFVTRADVPLAGNLRVMLDAFSVNKKFTVYLFKEKGEIPAGTLKFLQANGVRLLQGFNLKVLWALFSSKTVVLSHSARDAYITHRKPGRRVVNLWHGVALKQIENLCPLRGSFLQNAYRRSLIRRNSRIYDAMVASNSVDRLVNALAFDLPLHKVHPTGLPRFAYMHPEYAWPKDLQIQQTQLIEKLAGRMLVLYAPTFRDNGTSLTQLLGPEDLERIRTFCKQNHIVFGIRPHPYRSHELAQLCDNKHIINLSPKRFTESAVLLQQAHAMVVDYSSIWVDFLYLHRTLLAYTPDKEAYMQSDRGFVHDYDRVFPGPQCNSWAHVLQALEQRLQKGPTYQDKQSQTQAAQLLLPPLTHCTINAIEICAQVIAPNFNNQVPEASKHEKNHHLRHV